MDVNDQRFFDLAVKAIAQHSSEQEQAELSALLIRQPELKEEFERLQAQARIVKEVLPLLAATEATSGEVPAHARGRLQTKVRDTLKQSPLQQHKASDGRKLWTWRPLSALGTAVTTLLSHGWSSILKPQPTSIQVGILDVVGATRGSYTNVVGILQGTWQETDVRMFSTSGEFRIWMEDWPSKSRQPVVKVVYDRDAKEIHAFGQSKGKPLFDRRFPLSNEQDLETTLQSVRAFIEEGVRRTKRPHS